MARQAGRGCAGASVTRPGAGLARRGLCPCPRRDRTAAGDRVGAPARLALTASQAGRRAPVSISQVVSGAGGVGRPLARCARVSGCQAVSAVVGARWAPARGAPVSGGPAASGLGVTGDAPVAKGGAGAWVVAGVVGWVLAGSASGSGGRGVAGTGRRILAGVVGRVLVRGASGPGASPVTVVRTRSMSQSLIHARALGELRDRRPKTQTAAAADAGAGMPGQAVGPSPRHGSRWRRRRKTRRGRG